jgi:hypothetical protein
VVKTDQRFEGACCRRQQGDDDLIDDGGNKHLQNVNKFLPDL